MIPAAPNAALQPTPLCVEQDRAFLQVGSGSKMFPLDQGGAAERQAVSRLPSRLRTHNASPIIS
ncbi:MAG: hypothetical protein ACJ8CR_26790 [Roseiflexaceae bacterium]